MRHSVVRKLNGSTSSEGYRASLRAHHPLAERLHYRQRQLVSKTQSTQSTLFFWRFQFPVDSESTTIDNHSIYRRAPVVTIKTISDAPEVLFDPTRISGRSLRAIVHLHFFESAAHVVVLLFVQFRLQIDLPFAVLWQIVAANGVWNIASWLLLQRGKLDPIGSPTVFLQLLAEIFVLTSLLYLSGGSTNPFVSFYLVPIALAAMLLPMKHAALLVATTVLAYSMLMVWFVPIKEMSVAHGMSSLHIMGMWVNYVVSAFVVVVFLGFLARLSRQRAQQLAKLQEDMLRNQHVIALGSLAAGAAHSMSTPLSTIAVLVENMAGDLSDDERRETLELAMQQISECRSRLTDLMSSAGAQRLHDAREWVLSEYFKKLIAGWTVTRPDVVLTKTMSPHLEDVTAVLDNAFEYAIFNLLDNAADASTDNDTSDVSICVDATPQWIGVVVEDRGLGPTPGIESNSIATSSKVGGSGAGVLLTRAILSRLGGSLSYEALSSGCRATASIPLVSRDNDQ